MEQITGLPELTIRAAGAPLPPETLRSLVEVRVQQRLSLPTQCELCFEAPTDLSTLTQALSPGAAVEVTFSGHDDALFVGEITAAEHVYGPTGTPRLIARGYDRLHRLRKRQTVRSHVEMSLAELARELAGEAGLPLQAASTGPVWTQIIQHHGSDWSLLQSLAEQAGLYLYVRDGSLHLLTLEGTGASVSLVWGDSLLEARVEVNGEFACETVRASGWNPLRVESYEGRTASPRLARDVAAGVGPADLGGSAERYLPHQSVQSAGQVEAMAQAELDRRAGYTVTLRGLARGDPRLQPGTPVLVQGIAPELSGRYVLTAVTHTVSGEEGFLSELSTVPPAPQRAVQAAVAAPGQVSRVDDPERLGRIRVTLPTYGDLETEWLHVVSPGAGRDKGLVALPDVADDVLVLLSHADPSQGVVLGGLYGMEGPPDSGVEGNQVRRYTLRTPGGHLIRLDDQGSSLRVEDSSGSYIDMSPQRVRIHATVDLELEAPGRVVTVRGNRINFERA